MQSLFSFEQCKKANAEMARDHIREAFAPDLNSMEYQDKDQLKKDALQSIQLFDHSLAEEEVDIDVRYTLHGKEAQKALVSYLNENEQDRKYLRQQMLSDVRLVYKIYLKLLYLPLRFKPLAEAEILKSKNNPGIRTLHYANFLNSPILHILENDETFLSERSRNEAFWEEEDFEITLWFKEWLKKQEFFLEYLQLEKPTFEQDREFWLTFYQSIIVYGSMDDYLQSYDLHYEENKKPIKSMVSKTLKSMSLGKPVELIFLTSNWEEDREYFEDLYDSTINLSADSEKFIIESAQNWDFERITLADRVILKMAYAELIRFSNIPVKVTVNEYVDVSKKYSTPKSKKFVNGILDVMIRQLTADGKIKKSGRGLMDNK